MLNAVQDELPWKTCIDPYSVSPECSKAHMLKRFKEADSNNNGEISLREAISDNQFKEGSSIAKALTYRDCSDPYSFSCTSALKSAEQMKEMDRDSNGQISIEEALNLGTPEDVSESGNSVPLSALRKMFDAIDIDGDGLIWQGDVNMDKNIFQSADQDGDGSLTFEEFSEASQRLLRSMQKKSNNVQPEEIVQTTAQPQEDLVVELYNKCWDPNSEACAKAKEVFDALDDENTGFLTATQLEARGISAEEFYKMDYNRDGKCFLLEMEKYLMRKDGGTNAPNDVVDLYHGCLIPTSEACLKAKVMFEALDKTGDGFLNETQLKESGISSDQLYKIDLNRDGRVTLWEMETFLRRKAERTTMIATESLGSEMQEAQSEDILTAEEPMDELEMPGQTEDSSSEMEDVAGEDMEAVEMIAAERDLAEENVVIGPNLSLQKGREEMVEAMEQTSVGKFVMEAYVFTITLCLIVMFIEKIMR